MISCEGGFCGMQGSPPQGQPIVLDNECAALPISGFNFANGVESFQMPETVVDDGQGSTSTLELVGNAVEMSSTGNCVCG